MAKLWIKIFGFAFIILALSQLFIKPIVYHPFWGDPLYIVKHERFFETENNFNAVFVGSSRTFRNLDPTLFDSITGLNSFNFGIEEVGCPHNYYLLDKILVHRPDNLKYVFLELFSPEGNLGSAMQEVMKSDKVLYWYGLHEFIFSVRAIMESCSMSYYEKWQELSAHFMTLTVAEFKIGQLQRILNSKDKRKHNLYIGKNKKGFMSYSTEVKLPGNQYLIERQNEIKTDRQILEQRKFFSTAQYASTLSSCTELRFHWGQLVKLKEKCQSNDIELILLLHPLMTKEQYQYFHYLKRHKPIGITLLDYSNAATYPEFYELDNVFDRGHLNLKGTRIFTTTLSKDVVQILKQGVS